MIYKFSNMGLIYIFFRSGSDFGKLMRSLLGSLLKYNALEDFQKVSSRRLQKSLFQTTSKKSLPVDFKEVFQTTSKKSSTRLQRSLLHGFKEERSLPHDFLEVFQKTSNGVFFHIKWSLSLSL